MRDPYTVYAIRCDGELAYIGLTQHPLENRFYGHAHGFTLTGRAIRTIGRDRFTIEPLESFINETKARKAERNAIRDLNPVLNIVCRLKTPRLVCQANAMDWINAKRLGYGAHRRGS